MQRSGVTEPSIKRRNTWRETRTTPSYSPIATPNSTACRSGFQLASSGKVKNVVALRDGSEAPMFLYCSADGCKGPRQLAAASSHFAVFARTSSKETADAQTRAYRYRDRQALRPSRPQGALQGIG